eukprot:7481754-Karenia_brevis.AAC.1
MMMPIVLLMMSLLVIPGAVAMMIEGPHDEDDTGCDDAAGVAADYYYVDGAADVCADSPTMTVMLAMSVAMLMTMPLLILSYMTTTMVMMTYHDTDAYNADAA